MSHALEPPGSSRSKLEKLVDLLRNKATLLIVMQDNPDPDSIASAAALRRVSHAAGSTYCTISYGGAIGRSENRALADYLGLNFRHIDDVEPTKYQAIALVDTQPGTGNNSLPEGLMPDIVLDHHPLRPLTREVPFIDVRSTYGALSTILFEYLQELAITPEPPLATALLYGIRTDTQNLGAAATEADIRAVDVLHPLANPKMLSSIERWSVGPSYFQTLADALEAARIYEPCIVVEMDRVEHPDIIGEIADLFLRCQGVAWTLCSGYHQGKIWISLRTSQVRARAEDVMRHIVSDLGTGGGHDMLAGGQIPTQKGTGAERRTV